MRFLEGVYVDDKKYESAVRFQWNQPPTSEELASLTQPIAKRIGRYIAQPPVAEKRLSLTRNGMVRYQLKIPYHNGTTHVIFEPLNFISKLAALVLLGQALSIQQIIDALVVICAVISLQLVNKNPS
jgi:hypothetical protein